MKILRTPAALIGALLMASCSSSSSVASPPATGVPVAACEITASATITGRLRLPENATVESVVVSRSSPGFLWALSQDATGDPEVVAFDASGDQLAAIGLAPVFDRATDISLGPGPDMESDYLYVADFGSAWLPSLPVVVARLPEPAEGTTGTSDSLEVLEFVLPDGAGFPEAMFVDRRNGDVYLLTRTNRAVQLYRAPGPLSGAEPIDMQAEASYHPRAVRGLDGATAGPDGNTFGLRTTVGASLWRSSGDKTVAELMVEPICGVPFGTEQAGTVVALGADDLFGVDRFSHIVYAIPLPTNLGVVRDGTDTELGNLAPNLSITEPSSLAPWRAGEDTTVRAEVTDDQGVVDGDVAWELIVHRCSSDGPCLVETIDEDRGTPGVVSAGTIGGLAPSRLELRATYSDEGGLARVASIDLQPEVSSFLVESEPPGAEVSVSGVTGPAPLAIEAVVGDRLTVQVAPVQTIGERAFEFSGWSDGGERQHEVTVGPTDAALSLILQPEPGHVRFSGNGGSFAFTRVAPLSNISVFDVRVWVALADWSPENDQAVVGAQGKALQMEVTSAGRLRGTVVLNSGTVLEGTSSSPLNAAGSERLWLRATFDLDSGQIVFYTSREAVMDARAVEWTQFGEAVETGESGAVSSSVRNLVVGQSNRGTSRPMNGKLFGAAWLVDGRLLTSIDYSTTRQLTSRPPDYSTWGAWSLVGPDWEYVPSQVG